MPRPKVVVFDLGKVLLDFDFAKASRALSGHCSVPEPEIRAALDQSPLLHRYERGEIGSDAFFEEIKRATGFCKTYDQFAPLFGDIFSPIPEMIELNESLRAAGFPTYIFSNTNPLAADHIRERHPFFKNFTAYILSYEFGAMKPDPRIYAEIERVTKASGSEILYIDDRLENIEAARERSWQTIHQTDVLSSVSEARRLTGL